MDEKIKKIFTSELKSNAEGIFTDSDELAITKDLTSESVAQKAFESVFSDVLHLKTPEERRAKLFADI